MNPSPETRPMPGHVFTVRGDLRRLACDAWLMPAGADGRPQDKWLLPSDPPRDWPEPPAGWRDGRRRAVPVEDWPDDAPRPWRVNVEGDESTPPEWYLEGVRQFLRRARAALRRRPPRYGRA